MNKLLPLMSNVLIMKKDKKHKKGEGGGISGGTNSVVGHMGLMVRRQYLIFLFLPTYQKSLITSSTSTNYFLQDANIHQLEGGSSGVFADVPLIDDGFAMDGSKIIHELSGESSGVYAGVSWHDRANICRDEVVSSIEVGCT